jgi:hypothetical protein
MIKKFLHKRKILIYAASIFCLLLAVNSINFKAKTITESIYEDVQIKLDTKPFAAVDIQQNYNYKSKKEIESEIKKTNFPFGALAIEWEEDKPAGTEIKLYVQFLEESDWSEWFQVYRDDEIKFESEIEDKTNYSFMISEEAKAFKYKVVLFTNDTKISPQLSKIKFTYFNSTHKRKLFKRSLLSSLNVLFSDDPGIISRSEWGADESIRLFTGDIEKKKPIDYLYERDAEFYEKYQEELKIIKIIQTDKDGNYLTWPIEYPEQIEKIVIHHTATTRDLDDPVTAINNIYHYHTITKGWGDIGYNYIIDQEGNIYEGRYGGEKAAGAHAGKFNHGTIGIAVLGHYSVNEIPLPALKSLIHLIGEKAKLYDIKPDGFSTFRDIRLPNIVGHRDVGETSCPGDKIYRELNYIRKLLASNSKTSSSKETEEEFSFYETSERSIFEIKPETSSELIVELKNTGTETWDEKTRIVADLIEDSQHMVNFPFEDKMVSAIAKLEEKEVKSGEKGTFKIQIQAGLKSGLINFDLTPVFNGKNKTSSRLMLPIYVEQANFSYDLVSIKTPSSKVKKGGKAYVHVKLKNTGNVTWKNYGSTPIYLGTDEPKDRISELSNTNRPGELIQKEVKPGEIGRFLVKIKAPKSGGSFHEHLTPVIEGINWLEDKGIQFDIEVQGTTYELKFIETNPNHTFTPGETKEVWMKIKNSGDVDWRHRGKGLFKIKTLSKKAVKVPKTILLSKKLEGGDTDELKFNITAPKEPGIYNIYMWPWVDFKRLVKKPLYYRLEVVKPGQAQENEEKGGLIRMLISYEGNPIITGSGDFSLYEASQKIQDFEMDDNVEITYENDRYILKNLDQAFSFSEAPRFVPQNDTILEIQNFDRVPSWNPNVNDNRFRGTLEIRYLDNKLQIINELLLEDYLKGLAELPNDSATEKHKVLAILARSYAKYHRDNNSKFPNKPYDCTDDPNVCQKYLGYSYELRVPNFVKAVEATRGMIVTYEGKGVITPYFNQSDGKTRSAEELWGWTHTPYLQSVSDPYCEGKELRGHGVGLSGFGAEMAARDGKTYEEIIKYYYQGVEIEKNY